MPFTFRGKELPEHLEESLRAYVDSGRPTGDFLAACIADKLSLAVARADEENTWLIPVIAAWLHIEAPWDSWGKPDSFDNWIKKKRGEREKAGVR